MASRGERPRRVGQVLRVSSRTCAVDSFPIASKSAGAAWPALANAHAVLDSSCGLNSRLCANAAPSTSFRRLPHAGPRRFSFAMACATFDSSRAPNFCTRSVACSRKAASRAPSSLRSQLRSEALNFPSLLQQVARLISLNASPYFACRSSSSRARVDLLMSELICFGLVGALVCSAAVGPRSAVNTRHVACAAGALLWSSGVRIAQARRSAIPAGRTTWENPAKDNSQTV